MNQRRFLLAYLLTVSVAVNSCSQTDSTNTSAATVFVGSTPCDSLIKSTLNIPDNTICEFIKWELSLNNINKDSGSFQLTALFGESQPNTNGFKGSGIKLNISGKYFISYGTTGSPGRKFYHLTGGRILSEILLIEMDGNILHFADNKMRFMAGNAGFGYVLNRIQK